MYNTQKYTHIYLLQEQTSNYNMNGIHANNLHIIIKLIIDFIFI